MSAINRFGEHHQMQKAVEEMGELIVALCKGNDENVQEEIADVMIMMCQLQILFGEKEVEGWIEKKMRRLKRTIEKNASKKKKCVL